MQSKVVIRKPCAQKLDAMPRVADGIFCTVCKEKVIDLTRFSDEELADWMKKNAAEKPCGIYTRSQAKMPLQQRIIFPFRYAAISIGALLLAKTAKADFTETVIAAADTQGTAMRPADSAQKQIKGKVLSKRHREGMPAVTVFVAGTDSDLAMTSTAADGSFELTLPFTTDTSYTLTLTAKGYVTQVLYGYVPCDRMLVVNMKKAGYKDKKRRRRVYSKF